MTECNLVLMEQARTRRAKDPCVKHHTHYSMMIKKAECSYRPTAARQVCCSHRHLCLRLWRKQAFNRLFKWSSGYHWTLKERGFWFSTSLPFIVAWTCSSVSPRPSIIDVLETISGWTFLACFNTRRDWSKLARGSRTFLENGQLSVTKQVQPESTF